MQSPPSREEADEHVRMGAGRSGHDARRLRVFGFPQLLAGGRGHPDAHTHRPSGLDAPAGVRVRRRTRRAHRSRAVLFTARRYIIIIKYYYIV